MRYLEKHPMIMVAIGIIGISLSSILVKFSSAPSAVTAAYRLCWTVLLMTPAVLGDRKIRSEIKNLPGNMLALSVFSGLFLAMHFALWFESLHHTTVASSTTIVCTEVIWVALGYCLLMKGKISPKAIGAIFVTVAGSILIAMGDANSGSRHHLYGDALALLAALAVAAYTLIGRRVRKHVSTSSYTYVVYVSCAAALVFVCLAQDLPLTGYGIRAVFVGLLLAVLSTILGHSIFSWCLKFFSPTFVSASKLLEPVVAALLAAVLFGEVPALAQLLGSAMILGGVYYYAHLESRTEAK